MPLPANVPTVPVTLFSNAALQKAIDDKMDSLGPETTGGLLVHADLQGAVIKVTKAGEHWSVDVAAGITYGGQFEGQVDVIYRW